MPGRVEPAFFVAWKQSCLVRLEAYCGANGTRHRPIRPDRKRNQVVTSLQGSGEGGEGRAEGEGSDKEAERS